MNKILNFFISKIFIIAVLILLQLIFYVLLIGVFTSVSPLIYNVLLLFSLVMVVYVINGSQNPSFKISWVILIMTLPIMGGITYLMFGDKKVPKYLQKQALVSFNNTHKLFKTDEKVVDEIRKQDTGIAMEFDYLKRNAIFPTYNNSTAKYYGLGEDIFNDMLKDLQKAKSFIFFEYFIVEEGEMWNPILNILKEKVKEGVEVRVMYDDAGCIQTLPANYNKKLESYGIRTVVFNPLKPELAIQMNNRDHRKILVIDGVVGYTGGVNIADEYINVKNKYGHWKDGGVRLEGEAVYSLTVMFLQLFNMGFKKPQEFKKYRVKQKKEFKDGYVCPFSDSPTDSEAVGESVHINMINNSRKYVYINTPYLILDQEMTNSLNLAAKRGVDVRIVVPGVPDKWYVMLVTRANYRKLIEGGVKIYEYTPGFLHNKAIAVDDKVGFVGTINMDFRSYYLHFECGILAYGMKFLKDLKRDMDKTLSVSKEITLDDINKKSLVSKVISALLNILAPLM